jgi:hypothetical protein
VNAQTKRTPWLWPLILMAGSVILLLNNFMLIDIDLASYWPILLVLVGLQLLIRGDIGPGWQSQTFGITRGSVQSASLELESGEVDVQLQALRKSGRLIAGQYTARSRPNLTVRNNHATLRMQRGQTWWLSLADWDVGLAQDLPWGILISSYLGRLEVDLRGLLIERAYVSSGLGHVELICPDEAAGTLLARSTFGDVRLTIPKNSRAIVTVRTSPFARVRVDLSRFTPLRPGVYASLVDGMTIDDTAEGFDLQVVAATVFGSVTIV